MRNNFLNSQDLPQSPAHSNTRENEKRDLIRKEILAKDPSPHYSDDLGSLENFENDLLENNLEVQKITERLNERQSLDINKMSLIKGYDNNKNVTGSANNISDLLGTNPKIPAAETEGRNKLIEKIIEKQEKRTEKQEKPEKRTEKQEKRTEKTIGKPEKTMEKYEKYEKTIEKPEKTIEKPEKTIEKPQKPIDKPTKAMITNRNVEVIETFGSNPHLSKEDLEELISPSEKSSPNKASPLPIEPEEYREYVVARTKIESSWLINKDEINYFLYLLNSFFLLKCENYLENPQKIPKIPKETKEKNEKPMEKSQKTGENYEEMIKGYPEDIRRLIGFLRKNLKITHFATSKDLVLDRNTFILTVEKQVLMLKRGKRFNTIQQRIAVIPPFCGYQDEAMRKLAFSQKKNAKNQKKFGFPLKVYHFSRTQPSNMSLYSSSSQGKLPSNSQARLAPNSEGFDSDRPKSRPPGHISISIPSESKFDSFLKINKAVPWPSSSRTTTVSFRVDLVFDNRKTPVSLFFDKKEDCEKVYNLMLLKRTINDKLDLMGFFRKRAAAFYLGMALTIRMGIRKLISLKPAGQASPNRREGDSKILRIFDDRDAEKNSPETVSSRKKGGGASNIDVERKENRISEIMEDLDERRPEQRMNLEPKVVVNFEANLELKEKLRVLRNSPVLNHVTAHFLGDFISKWLTAASKAQETSNFSEKKLIITVKKLEIPQKLCFYKPKLDVSLEISSSNPPPPKEKSSAKLKKQADKKPPIPLSKATVEKSFELHIDSRSSSSLKSFNILGFLEKTSSNPPDISSMLAANDTVILWKPGAEAKLALIPEKGQRISAVFEAYDEGGFSFLSNLAQNLDSDPKNKEKFITHSLKIDLTDTLEEVTVNSEVRSCFLALQPLFSKAATGSEELVDRLLLELEISNDFQAKTVNFSKVLIAKDPIFKVPLSSNRCFLNPKFLTNPETLSYIEKSNILDFEEKFAIFRDFSDSRLVLKVRERLDSKKQELIAKSYIKSCSGFLKIARGLPEFSEVFDKLGSESAEYLNEFITGLAARGLPNEARLLSYLSQRKKGFIEKVVQMTKEYIRIGYGRKKELASDQLTRRLEVSTVSSEELMAILEEICRNDDQTNVRLFKSEFLYFFQFFESSRLLNKASAFKILWTLDFLFTKVLNRPLILTKELFLILSDIFVLFNSNFPFFPLETIVHSPNPVAEVFLLLSLIVYYPLSRYNLLNSPPQTPKNFQSSALPLANDFKGLKGDIVLLREYLREKLPDQYKHFELGAGNPIGMEPQFSAAFGSLCSSLNLRKDLLFRLWDIFLNIEAFESLRKNSFDDSREVDVAISESVKVYIIAFIIAGIKRTARFEGTTRDFGEFVRRMGLILDLIEDIDEFINEMLFERLEIIEFMGKKGHILLELENQHLQGFQKKSAFLRASRKTMGTMGFSLGSLQNYMHQWANTLELELDGTGKMRILHVFLHFLNIYHNTGSENSIILELFYEKSSFYFSFLNSDERRVRLGFYEKMRVNPRNQEAFLRVFESSEKMPEKIDNKFKSQLKLLRFATINLRNLRPNTIESQFYRLNCKEPSYNFAASEAFISVLIEEESEFKAKPFVFPTYSKITVGNSKNTVATNSKGPQIFTNIPEGFRRVTDFKEDYDDVPLLVPDDLIARCLEPLHKAMLDVQDLKPTVGITSGLLEDSGMKEREDWTLEFEELKKAFRYAEAGQVSEAELIQLFQALVSINQPNKQANSLDFLISAVLNAKGSFGVKKALFFAILQKGNTVPISRFKAFIRTLYEIMSVNYQNNEIDNLIENLLVSSDFIRNFIPNIKKAEIQIKIAKSFSQIYDIKDIFLLFIGKKHRIFKGKGIFFGPEGDFSQLRSLLEFNRENNPKLKEFFNFIDKNSFDRDSKNEIILKIQYTSPFRRREVLETRLDRDFQSITPNSSLNSVDRPFEYRYYSDEKSEFSDNYNESKYSLKPVMRLMGLHGSAFALDLWDFAIDRRTFVYLLDNLPFLGYYFQIFRTLNNVEFVGGSGGDVSGMNLWVQVTLEDEKIISVLLDVNSEINYESFEEIQRNYYVLANEWRSKFNLLSIPTNKSTIDFQKTSNIRNRIFDKEIKIMGISMFMPLASLILKIQKVLLETFLKNPESVTRTSFFQWDFFRTHFYLHFPNKVHRIDVFNNDLYQLIQTNSSDFKMLVVEYKVKKPEDASNLYQTFDSMLNFKEKSALSRDQRVFNEYTQLALFRFADHSTEWLPAKVIGSYLLNNNKEEPIKNDLNVKIDEIYSFFEVEYSVFPEESYLKKPAEVIFLEEIDLWRIRNNRKNNVRTPQMRKINEINKETAVLEDFFKKKNYIEKKNEKIDEELEEIREDLRNLSSKNTENNKFEEKNGNKSENLSENTRKKTEENSKNEKMLVFNEEKSKKTEENNVFETHEFYEDDEEDSGGENQKERYFNPKEQEVSSNEKGTLNLRKNENILGNMKQEDRKTDKFEKIEKKIQKIEKNHEKNTKNTEKTEKSVESNESPDKNSGKNPEKADIFLKKGSSNLDKPDNKKKPNLNVEIAQKAQIKVEKSKKNTELEVVETSPRKSSIENEVDADKYKKQQEKANKLLNFKYDDKEKDKKVIKVTKVEENKEEQEFNDSLELDD